MTKKHKFHNETRTSRCGHRRLCSLSWSTKTVSDGDRPQLQRPIRNTEARSTSNLHQFRLQSFNQPRNLHYRREKNKNATPPSIRPRPQGFCLRALPRRHKRPTAPPSRRRTGLGSPTSTTPGSRPCWTTPQAPYSNFTKRTSLCRRSACWLSIGTLSRLRTSLLIEMRRYVNRFCAPRHGGVRRVVVVAANSSSLLATAAMEVEPRSRV